jgi:hypothetical protein
VDWLGTLLDNIQEARQVAALLEADAKLLAHDGKPAEAWRSAQSIYRVSTSIGNPDMNIILLVRIATRTIALNTMERVLGQSEVPAEALADTQKLLEDDLKEPILWLGMRGERAGMHRLFTALEDGTISLSQLQGRKNASRDPSEALEAISTFLGGDVIRPSHIWLLEHMREAVEAAKLPAPEKAERFKEIDLKISKDQADGSIPLAAALLLPAYVKIAEADVRSGSHTECAICALACERYRLRHKKWPGSLEELVKEKLITKVPTDPYSGKPLSYRRTENGIIVFAVGKDGDNKGDSLDDPDIQTPQWRVEFRLWNRDKRGQAPRPPKKNAPGNPDAE